MIEYTVPHDAEVIIVDGVKNSREFFNMLCNDRNIGKFFKLKKTTVGKMKMPVIEATWKKQVRIENKVFCSCGKEAFYTVCLDCFNEIPCIKKGINVIVIPLFFTI